MTSRKFRKLIRISEGLLYFETLLAVLGSVAPKRAIYMQTNGTPNSKLRISCSESFVVSQFSWCSYGLHGPGSISDGSKGFFFTPQHSAGSGAHPASYPSGTELGGGFFFALWYIGCGLKLTAALPSSPEPNGGVSPEISQNRSPHFGVLRAGGLVETWLCVMLSSESTRRKHGSWVVS
jgi:hypothetical protein